MGLLRLRPTSTYRQQPSKKAKHLLLEPLEHRDLLSTCHVTRLSDAGVGKGFRGDLRYCINKVNTEPGPDVIDFTVTGKIDLNSPLPNLASDISIQGPGESLLTIDVRETGRGFYIPAGANVEIANLTIENGKISGNGAGGANIFNAGSLTLVYVTVRGGRAQASGIQVSTCYAGGIFNDATGQLTLFQTTVSDNSSYGSNGSGYVKIYGAGVSNLGSAIMVMSTITSNEADTGFIVGYYVYGAGVYNAGSMLIDSSVIYNNSAGSQPQKVFGGGIASQSGSITIQNSTIANNQLTGFKDAYGGGVSLENTTAEIRNSTIVGNVSVGEMTSEGGGIRLSGGSLTLQNTILAANWASTGGPDVFAVFTSLGHNLIGDPTGGSGFAPSDLLGVDPMLGPLQDNGGPTATLALLPGSPAIDTGDNSDATNFDQRGPGFPRIVNDTIDTGAFEVQATAAPSAPFDIAILVSAELDTDYSKWRN